MPREEVLGLYARKRENTAVDSSDVSADFAEAIQRCFRVSDRAAG
jgi:hypothetical protein